MNLTPLAKAYYFAWMHYKAMGCEALADLCLLRLLEEI